MSKAESVDSTHDGRDATGPVPDRRQARDARAILRPAIAAALLGVGLLASSHAGAQTFGDAAAGQALARRWCVSCHLVDAGQPTALANGVPTFAGIARMPSTTALSLRVFLQTPHIRMPDFNLTQEEIGDVTAYILTLKRR